MKCGESDDSKCVGLQTGSQQYNHAILCKAAESTDVVQTHTTGCMEGAAGENTKEETINVREHLHRKHLESANPCESWQCVTGGCSMRPTYSRTSSISGCAGEAGVPLHTVWSCKLALQCLNLTLSQIQTIPGGDAKSKALPTGCNYVVKSRRVYFQPNKGGTGRHWADQLCKLHMTNRTARSTAAVQSATALEPSSQATSTEDAIRPCQRGTGAGCVTSTACSARRCMANGSCTTAAKYTSTGCGEQNVTQLLSQSPRSDPEAFKMANRSHNEIVEMGKCAHAQRCLGLDVIAALAVGKSRQTYQLSQQLPPGCLYSKRMRKRFLNFRGRSNVESSSDMQLLGSSRLSPRFLKQGWLHICTQPLES